MNKFLLELLTEEIPSNEQKKLEKVLHDNFVSALDEMKIKFENIETFSTPRRVALLINGIAEIKEAFSEEMRGPRVGASSNAIEGFLKSKGIKQTQLEVKTINNTEYYIYKKQHQLQHIKEILPNLITEKILDTVKFIKSMKWNDSNIFWSRPIRSILALYQTTDSVEVIPFKYAGLNSSNVSYGHRFFSDKQGFIVENIDDYFNKLHQNQVMLGFDKRKDYILEEVAKIQEKYEIINCNSELIDEIVGLVEFPNILIAHIPDNYMSLPKELLINIISSNQKYLTFEDKEQKLSKIIIIVSNNPSVDEETSQIIINGNLKVLKARLDDGLFFYNNDILKDFSSLRNNLKDINYFKGIGTIYDKTIRVEKLFSQLFKQKADLLCSLYKNDLVSEVVFEIPELQGIMGYYYSLASDYDEEIALAIKEHYKPQGQQDELPQNLLGAKLSLADKLDALISFFAINKKPTGSKDPFALRRSALGIIRIILGFKIHIDLNNVVNDDTLIEFIKERYAIFLQEKYPKFVINKFLHQEKDSFDILSIYNQIISFNQLLITDHGKIVLEMKKRLENIIKSQSFIELKDLSKDLLITKEEQILYEAYIKVESLVSKLESNNLKDLLHHLSSFETPINDFLDKIIINKSSSLEIKENRLSLLWGILKLINKV